jgi:4-amino-4-deoxy-L-arabinose transferase-like glycosyltransferase
MLSAVNHSWQTSSAPPPVVAAAPPITAAADTAWRPRLRVRALALRAPRPELLGLLSFAAVLNLWALSRNGWANEYYSAAVRSMSSSWHNFLFASLDPSGVMTVDKPPLALWVQALSVRIFGYHSLSMLVPQALMGVASVALLYDLVRRRFGRAGGFIAGLALAITPITVAISRHNNPDALLVLCCVAALWCAVRALEGGRTRWLIAAGAFVGLGFETKMGVALTVVPGIAAAWLWISPAGRGRLHALRQLLVGGAAMVIVGGAWPALVQLTPAADRPWVSGTSDNSIFSLMFEYNGLGRVEGQTGGPGGHAGGSSLFGGSAGPLRLFGSALGGQVGWLLGFALIAGLALAVSSRLLREDARSGWLLAVGGAFLTTALLFSFAGGIFHPYYVALLAPFLAALVGAGAGGLIGGGLNLRIVGPLALLGGVAVELIIRAQYPGQLTWLAPVLIVVGLLAAGILLVVRERLARLAALGTAIAALMLAPGVWAFDTLGHAASGTFPAGGPASAEGGGGGGPFGGFGGARRLGGRGAGAAGAPQLFGAGIFPGGAQAPPRVAPNGAPPGLAGPPPGRGGARGGFGAGGAFGGGAESLKSVLAYVSGHGGGTIAVASQSSAASAIIAKDAHVAGIGGFSGRESNVSAAWLAQEVSAGKIRWVVGEQAPGGGFSGRLPGDTRTGSRPALSAVAQACTKVTLSSSAGSSAGTLYDCRGHAAALAGAGARQS